MSKRLNDPNDMMTKMVSEIHKSLKLETELESRWVKKAIHTTEPIKAKVYNGVTFWSILSGLRGRFEGDRGGLEAVFAGLGAHLANIPTKRGDWLVKGWVSGQGSGKQRGQWVKGQGELGVALVESHSQTGLTRTGMRMLTVVVVFGHVVPGEKQAPAARARNCHIIMIVEKAGSHQRSRGHLAEGNS